MPKAGRQGDEGERENYEEGIGRKA